MLGFKVKLWNMILTSTSVIVLANTSTNSWLTLSVNIHTAIRQHKRKRQHVWIHQDTTCLKDLWGVVYREPFLVCWGIKNFHHIWVQEQELGNTVYYTLNKERNKEYFQGTVEVSSNNVWLIDYLKVNIIYEEPVFNLRNHSKGLDALTDSFNT